MQKFEGCQGFCGGCGWGGLCHRLSARSGGPKVGGCPGAEDSSEPLRCQITMFLGREAEKEAQMCERLHICPQQNLWAFICLCLCPGCARLCLCEPCQPCVCACLCLYVSRPLSESVAVGVYACLGGTVWFCVWKFICVCGLPCVLDCACLRAACNRPLELLVCICRAGWPSLL